MVVTLDIHELRESGRDASRKMKTRFRHPSSWTLPKQSSSIAPSYVWSNADQDPVPVEKRTWDGYAFVMYWFSDLVTVSGWSAASSIMTTGLTTTDAILIILVAAMCNAIPTVLNGAIGANLNIPFPIAIRASYGYWLSYFCVMSRGILALFWFGIQSAYGGGCITPIITAIWPSYANLPNHLPASAGITTQGMVSYFLYNLVQFPSATIELTAPRKLLLVPTHKLQYMFWVKTICVPPTALAMVIWISCKAGGGSQFFHTPATVHGSSRAWLWLSTMTSVTGGFSTLTVNIPDFARFSKKPKSQVWQLPFIPFFKLIVGIFGIISASASQKIYGETLWSPLDIIDKWQGSSGGRAAAFFCALVWLIAQISTNISSNSVSFANDITTLVPKYFNIKRGVVFVALIGGWALCPWLIVQSASTFLNFMSAYAIFMSAFAGIMATDYWLVKRRRYDVPALYDPRGIYRYRHGINWRALVVTALVIVPMLPGLAYKVTPGTVHIDAGLQHLFTFNWLYGFTLSVVLYYGLNLLWPDKATLIPETVYGAGSVIVGVERDAESGESGESEESKGKLGLGVGQVRDVGVAAVV